MNPLEKEIERLKYELAVTFPEEIKNALELGDWGDNSEFSEIIARQNYTSIRLKQLIDRLNAYKSIDLKTISKDKIGLGSVIKVLHQQSNAITIYKIVAVEISDTENSEHEEVTVNSPIGKALYDKCVGDEVTVYLPSGKKTYKILEIKTVHDC
jgi:transcription elongation factor GreA